jgi:UPF0755 protein
MSRSRIILKVGIALVAATMFVGAAKVYDILYGPNEFPGGGEKMFRVSRGQTFASVVDSLESSGIIRSRPLFVFVAKLFGGSNRIKVGKYDFPSGVSNLDIFFSLREGNRKILIPVTLKEGLRASKFASILARDAGIDSTRYVELVSNERFARSLGIGRSSLEGYLMPETYHLQWQDDEEEILKQQVRQFKKAFDDSLVDRANALGFSMHEVVTLASIIEGEAVLDEERARISGVYHNRLRKGMMLQADPTIQYFIENGPRRVKYSDLKIDHPYNTYRRKGLPPGPVNNPGRESLVAALYPEDHKYLYFVANWKGGHWFSTSYSEHMRYVRMHRRVRAERQVESTARVLGPG